MSHIIGCDILIIIMFWIYLHLSLEELKAFSSPYLIDSYLCEIIKIYSSILFSFCR